VQRVNDRHAAPARRREDGVGQVVIDAVGVDHVGAEIVDQSREVLARLARMEETRQSGQTGGAGARRERRREAAAPIRRLVVRMVNGEVGAEPTALADWREMVEVHALGAALAMTPAMDREQSNGASLMPP
jgi:hypothetical protein